MVASCVVQASPGHERASGGSFARCCPQNEHCLRQAPIWVDFKSAHMGGCLKQCSFWGVPWTTSSGASPHAMLRARGGKTGPSPPGVPAMVASCVVQASRDTSVPVGEASRSSLFRTFRGVRLQPPYFRRPPCYSRGRARAFLAFPRFSCVFGRSGPGNCMAAAGNKEAV